MKIGQIYSHLNGLEFLEIRKPHLLKEIKIAIENVDANKAFEKVNKEKTKLGRTLYSPSKLNKLFQEEFKKFGWQDKRTSYFVNEDLQTTKETYNIQDRDIQKREIENRGFKAFRTYNQIDFVK
ncbi:hypothetical protein [Helicobacter cappadocius]|uniref:hypothetical protein n=1 Tax=Helicobacter cappadocius TaxID=3063998 RepID=UPI00351F4F19